jgi:arginine-tRNA-protein transferase
VLSSEALESMAQHNASAQPVYNSAMQSLHRCLAPPGQCGYLPDQTWRLEYEFVIALTPEEYMTRLEAGWRRFGHALFRPRCQACSACRSLRVNAKEFRADRSQRRARKKNEGSIRLEIGEPTLTREKLALYDRYHACQAERKGWPAHDRRDAAAYEASFIDNPFPVEEWCYYAEDRLVGVGYVDAMPRGLSAIYYIHEPALRHQALGTWNVLSILDAARSRGLPWVYLGYYVAGCSSMQYKAHFRPHQLLGTDGRWED